MTYNKVYSPLLVILLFSLGGRLKAEATATGSSASRKAVETKVAYIDLESIMGMDLSKGAQEWTDLAKGLQVELQEQYRKIAQDQERLKTLGAELDEAGGKDKKERTKWLSEEALEKERTEKLKEATRLKSDIEFGARALEERQTRDGQKLQFTYFNKVQKKAEQVAREQGWDLVLIGGSVFTSARADITADVLDALNKEYSASKTSKKPAEKPSA
jgi:Skp family chaperone for outer membrane proteins